MSLVVIGQGTFTTVQDLGRPRFRSWGVPIGGVFDVVSAGLANALVGNPPESAILEMTYVGGSYEASTTLALAFVGAPMIGVIRRATGIDLPLESAMAFPLRPGDRLLIGGTPRGTRAYLAVRGGWLMPEILGSRSSEKPVRLGDRLPCIAATTPVRRVKSAATLPPAGVVRLRVIDGPDANAAGSSWLDPGRTYRVGIRSDRMGVRLEGEPCEVIEIPERLSTPVAPGSVQMAGGLPLILGVACGTMGGYPHVADVISADLPRLAQLGPGNRLGFERVSLEEARDLGCAARQTLRAVSATVRTLASDGLRES